MSLETYAHYATMVLHFLLIRQVAYLAQFPYLIANNVHHPPFARHAILDFCKVLAVVFPVQQDVFHASILQFARYALTHTFFPVLKLVNCAKI